MEGDEWLEGGEEAWMEMRVGGRWRNVEVGGEKSGGRWRVGGRWRDAERWKGEGRWKETEGSVKKWRKVES